MSNVSAMTAVRSTPQRARDVLLTVAYFDRWISPELRMRVRGGATTLKPGDRFRMEVPGGIGLEYEVEAVTDREVVFTFTGPWDGRERWSFIADGEETIVRRVHEARYADLVQELTWRLVGMPIVTAHFTWEMGRFRRVVEKEPGVRGEIESSAGRQASAEAASGAAETAPAQEPEREVPRRAQRGTADDVPRERESSAGVERESLGGVERESPGAAETGSAGPGFPVDEG
ncbi:MAG TPA: hypothetical protein VFK13_12045 [Gemmatimonadaceae bacterium]|nr:hypothetical protein [Gemmatimonadaceae bacterium]